MTNTRTVPDPVIPSLTTNFSALPKSWIESLLVVVRRKFVSRRDQIPLIVTRELYFENLRDEAGRYVFANTGC